MLVFNLDINSTNISLKKLIHFAETSAVTDCIFKEYIVTSLLKERNALSDTCEVSPVVGASLKSAAIKDLETIWKMLSNDPLNGYVASATHEHHFFEYGQSLKNIVESSNPSQMLDGLILHYQVYGGGKSSQYFAFKWENGLKGISNPDNISLGKLYCVDEQKSELVKNTSCFLKGMPYNNAILYGDRGSGKSSMVKAILNEFYKDGLRMAEIPKQHLSELAKLIDKIKKKKFHYIVFLDDLSFEQGELDYKKLKVILDGQTEKQPQNIVFYATSNRRHIVNETWDDRKGSDIHISDTINEKLSLSERFGINLYFPSQNQEQYLAIAKGILLESGISLNAEIKAEAIKWAALRSGRTGRIAAQFAKNAASSKHKEPSNN